jgi:hypothetical protein
MKWISYKDKPIPDGFDYFRGMRFYVIQFKKPDEDPRYPGDYDIELAIAAYYFDGNWMCSEIKNENQIINYAEIEDIPKEPYEQVEEFRKKIYKS